MATSEDQIRALGALEGTMRHVLEKLQSIDERLGAVITRAEHDAKLETLHARIQRLEEDLKSQSPMSTWERMTKIAGGIVTIATALGVLGLYATRK